MVSPAMDTDYRWLSLRQSGHMRARADVRHPGLPRHRPDQPRVETHQVRHAKLWLLPILDIVANLFAVSRHAAIGRNGIYGVGHIWPQQMKTQIVSRPHPRNCTYLPQRINLIPKAHRSAFCGTLGSSHCGRRNEMFRRPLKLIISCLGVPGDVVLPRPVQRPRPARLQRFVALVGPLVG